MTNGQRRQTLLKRAMKAKNTLNCSNDEARDYAHQYKEYLLDTPLNAPCL
jgi:hypothetical protein